MPYRKGRIRVKTHKTGNSLRPEIKNVYVTSMGYIL
jgi:hypothetical protein